MHCLFLWCVCWSCNRFVLLLTTCSMCFRMWCRHESMCWGQSYWWHQSVLACMLTCTQMLDPPHCLWCTCVWCTNYTSCFEMCGDHNLWLKGRMSYSELFLMFFFSPNIFNKIQSLGREKTKTKQDLLLLAGFRSESKVWSLLTMLAIPPI